MGRAGTGGNRVVVVAQRGLTAAAVLLAAALLVAGCATPIGTAFDPNVYRVRAGDTLYSIAWRYQIDYQDLLRWNDIDDPDNIHPGDRIRLGPRSAAADRSAQAVAQAPRDRVEQAPAPVPAPDGRSAVGTWRWPTQGEVVGTFTDGRLAGRGVDIAGSEGQPVQATAAGQVVYSGNGLQAYGQLIIIRHAGDFLSAYAHNKELLVKEGKRVANGQQIARMGRNLDGEALLHFEIRYRGRPVDPLDYLPPRD